MQKVLIIGWPGRSSRMQYISYLINELRGAGVSITICDADGEQTNLDDYPDAHITIDECAGMQLTELVKEYTDDFNEMLRRSFSELPVYKPEINFEQIKIQSAISKEPDLIGGSFLVTDLPDIIHERRERPLRCRSPTVNRPSIHSFLPSWKAKAGRVFNQSIFNL